MTKKMLVTVHVIILMVLEFLQDKTIFI